MDVSDSDTRERLRCWLLLARAPGIGPTTAVRLLERLGDVRALLGAPDALVEFNLKPRTLAFLSRPDWPAVDADLEWLSGHGRRLVCIDAPDYPDRLRQIAAAPLVLFLSGNADLLTTPQIAVVGSRNPSRTGLENASAFSRELAACGFTVTSGMALGIDAAAHRGALAAQGATIAVAGTGLERAYPASHAGLARDIVDGGGLLLSEFPTGTSVRPQNFPRRNRIISGLSLGVMVVEAARASGSLITARHALEQGREVFAIPGSIHNPVARGCHALIREGAILTESVGDILDEFRDLAVNCGVAGTAIRTDTETAAGCHADDRCKHLLTAMGFDPVTVDILMVRTGLTAKAVSSMLLRLELEGHVSSQAGGAYVRCRRRG